MLVLAVVRPVSPRGGCRPYTARKQQRAKQKRKDGEKREKESQAASGAAARCLRCPCRQVLFVPSTAVVDGSVGGRSCGVCGFEIPISRKGNASVLFQLACGGGLRTSFALIPIFFAKLRRRRSMLIYGGSAVEQNHECRDHAEETCGEEGIVTNE